MNEYNVFGTLVIPISYDIFADSEESAINIFKSCVADEYNLDALTYHHIHEVEMSLSAIKYE